MNVNDSTTLSLSQSFVFVTEWIHVFEQIGWMNVNDLRMQSFLSILNKSVEYEWFNDALIKTVTWFVPE